MKAGSALLLDSCAVIAHFKRNESVLKMLQLAGGLYLPLAAYGELYYGALKAAKYKERLNELNEFVKIVVVLTPNQDTAKIYGDIRLLLALRGQPIPENDLWIAATAKQYAMPLLTGDAHFERVEGIKLEVFGK